MLEEFRKRKFDIIVLIGQSNASGSGLYKAGEEPAEDGDILMLRNEYAATVKTSAYGNEYLDMSFSDKYEISPASGDREGDTVKGNLILTFAAEYKKHDLKAGRKILIVNAAIGGTGFSKNHWGVGDVLYERMMKLTDMALSLNPENRLAAFIWHQGEHDSYENAQFNYKERNAFYYGKLTEMVKGIRAKYGVVPFISAAFTKIWYRDYKEQCDAVYAAIERVAKENPAFAFIKDTEDLKCNDDVFGNKDVVHFCGNALNELGRRYYKAYKTIVG